MEELLDFGDALVALRQGRKVSRRGWNGKGMALGLQYPDEHSANTLPYIYMLIPKETPHQYHRVPWLASQTDMLADDWEMHD